MAAIFDGTKVFENWVSYSLELPCGPKISLKSLYLAQFFVFCIFEKNLKIQNGRHFLVSEIFVETRNS